MMSNSAKSYLSAKHHLKSAIWSKHRSSPKTHARQRFFATALQGTVLKDHRCDPVGIKLWTYCKLSG